MLPFLKKKQDSVAGLIIKQRAPDKHNDSNELEEKEYSLEDCAQDIMEAIQSNNKSKLAEALREAIKKVDEEPHEEGEHVSPHTYEAQNIKAAKKE